MVAPFFFEEHLPLLDELVLSEETSRHIVQVLRMKEGEQVIITNGKGYTMTAEILSAGKKKTLVKVVQKEFYKRPLPETAIAISLIKNTNRFEWFIEKATEIGISSVIPLVCRRSEKTHFRADRIRAIFKSALLQSRQSWLPGLSDPVQMADLMEKCDYGQKLIAHCLPEEKKELKDVVDREASKIILIGPEGDFTGEEIRMALDHRYIPVSLGPTRLRTETAGIVAAVLFKCC